MTILPYGLDDDDILTLHRYRPFGVNGIDRILRKLKHAVTPEPEETITLPVQLPAGVVNWLASTDPHFRNEGHLGQALNALTHAARYGVRQ